MKEVKFERIKSQYKGYGVRKGSKYHFDQVEEIIRLHIEEGWEYCGFVPLETRGTGDIELMSLIFQREK